MENKLKRVLDFKLVYDCLAEASSGMVSLETLLYNWPPRPLALAKLPQGCEKFWRQSATPDGFLDWDSFSTGLEKALKNDEDRLSKEKHHTSSHNFPSLQVAARSPIAQVTTGEIEGFLATCQAGILVKALAKAGRDVHRWRVSVHKQNAALQSEKENKNTSHSHSVTDYYGHCRENTAESTTAKMTSNKKSRSSLSAAREREELVRGAEILENTQQWFQSRLAVLSLEEQQKGGGNELVSAEDLLAELEGGEDSQTLHHLKKINTHLSSLALTAHSNLPASQTLPVAAGPQHNSSSQPIAIVEYPRQIMHPQKTVPHLAGTKGRGSMNRSISLPREYQARAVTLNHATLPPPAPCRKPFRSSSFNDKTKGALGSQPVRAVSSMSTLVHQCTDYPGHHPQPSPISKRPIRHSSSVHSLPGGYYQHPPPSRNAPPPLFSHPPSRAHSTQSLTRRASSPGPGHHLVSEVL